MSKSFEPFFGMGCLLDSDSFKGGLARGFLSYFDEMTCIEASDIGWRCACSSGALERDAFAARLRAIHRSGIFLMSEWRGQTKVLFAVIAQKFDLEKTLLEVDICP